MSDHRITKENIDSLLDSHRLEIAMNNGRWWAIRRNGQTRRWKRDADRILIPIKFGLRLCGQINESHFRQDGAMDPTIIRIKAS